MKKKILTFCDSPTLTTGFARVAQNLFRRWHDRHDATIDVWAIGFTGWGYKKCSYVNTLFPGSGMGQGHWSDPRLLETFLATLQSGEYSHVWLMQDTFMLSKSKFPDALKDVCKQRGIRSTLYFPVDAPLDPQWLDIVRAVDAPITYTEYGRQEAIKAGLEPSVPLQVIPHGVEGLYKPYGPGRRAELRETLWQEKWLTPADFLMVNVNTNQRRKDVARSLEILAELKRGGPPTSGGEWRLLMHMPNESQEGLNLETVALQLGLSRERDWGHHDVLFRKGHGLVSEEQMPQFYNVADLCLTTTLGEGWGFSTTEALGCGCPVALPCHTSCAEIVDRCGRLQAGSRFVQLPVEAFGVVCDWDNSRLRYRVRVAEAANLIRDYEASWEWRKRPELSTWPELRDWLSWGRIAELMWQALMGEK